MTNKLEKSWQQWEQEIRARQQSVIPADYPKGLHYMRRDALPKAIAQWRFWLGIVLVALGASMLRASVPVGIAALAGVGVAAGLLLTITAMRLNKITDDSCSFRSDRWL